MLHGRLRIWDTYLKFLIYYDRCFPLIIKGYIVNDGAIIWGPVNLLTIPPLIGWWVWTSNVWAARENTLFSQHYHRSFHHDLSAPQGVNMEQGFPLGTQNWSHIASTPIPPFVCCLKCYYTERGCWCDINVIWSCKELLMKLFLHFITL